MSKFRHLLGEIVEWVLGDRKVVEFQGPISFREIALSAQRLNPIQVKCRQILYQITYDRWWIPIRYLAVYEVSCVIPDDQADRYDPNLTIPRTYPMLVNRFLSRTRVPHTHAIKAFLDQFGIK